MPDDEKLTPADPDDLAAALAFALKFEGRKRWHEADPFMADIVAKRRRRERGLERPKTAPFGAGSIQHRRSFGEIWLQTADECAREWFVRSPDLHVVPPSRLCLARELFVVDGDLMFASDCDIHNHAELGVDKGERMKAVGLGHRRV
jgi:hypothetical protein